MKCPVCDCDFDQADRAGPTTQEGAIVQILYCSVKCQRKARNSRNYQRHRQQRIQAVMDRRKVKR